MGSSLTVTPAADMPKDVGVAHKLVIVNLQKTPLDGVAAFKINALCDDVMTKLMAKLEIVPESYRLVRYVHLDKKKEDVVEFEGIDATGIPYTFLKNAVIQGEKNIVKPEEKGKPLAKGKEPYVFKLPKG